MDTLNRGHEETYSESEKRIYVVVADVLHPLDKGRVEQPLGRQFAQGCHAVSKMRHYHDRSGKKKFEMFTTITLSARNGMEMFHISRLLDGAGIAHEFAHDKNLEAYGEGRFHTAFATVPVTKVQVLGILDYLPLWGSVDHLKFVAR